MEIRNGQSVSFDPHVVARGLGWFSIALGFTELVFARALASLLGMRGQEHLIRGYGARELATGIGILASSDPAPWIWGRVAGDALDIATLGTAVRTGNPERANVAVALGAVAGATALDVITAQALAAHRRAVARDAAHDFEATRDRRTPDPLGPRTLH